MRIVTSNIKNSINGALFSKRVRQTSYLGGILLFQEIKGEADHRNLRAALGDGYFVSHENLSIPIAVPFAEFEVISVGERKMHDGKKLTSPSRWVTWVVVRHRGTGIIFVVINTHFVSGAWNRKPKLNKKWRKHMWEQHFDRMRTVILNFVERGMPVAGGGDFNRKEGVEKFTNSQVWVANVALDKLFFIDGNNAEWCLRNEGKKDITRIRDHKAWWMALILRRK